MCVTKCMCVHVLSLYLTLHTYMNMWILTIHFTWSFTALKIPKETLPIKITLIHPLGMMLLYTCVCVCVLLILFRYKKNLTLKIVSRFFFLIYVPVCVFVAIHMPRYLQIPEDSIKSWELELQAFLSYPTLVLGH